MADFDDTQIEEYIKKWFDLTPDQYRHQLDKEMKTADRCWNTLKASEHSATKELARNPLLLAMLCIVYDETQDFPRNRADLYEKALTIFLERWAAEKRVDRGPSMNKYLDISAEKRMLSEIAARNFEANRFFFSKDELINQIREFGARNVNTIEMFNARKILDTILIDQGLFVERVRGSYSFSHLTFQEYLTANYIVRDTRSIKALAKKHLHDHQWREVFLLTSGLMHEANDLLKAMEAEAAKLINTPKFKALFRWAERITDTTDDQDNISKRLFAIRQYFFLWLFNEIDEVVKKRVQYDLHFYRYLNLDYYQYIYPTNLKLNHYLYFNLYLKLDVSMNFYLYLSNTELKLDLYLGPDLYLDLYRYVDPYFYTLFSPASGDRFDKELEGRIAFIKHIEEMRIFKGVDLQRMVQRFNEQRKFIKAAAEMKSVVPPSESIHDTWLSVLGITDEMLAISYEELEKYLEYLHTMEFIIKCRKAAGRVSPDVWQGIENRFLTGDKPHGI